jgi:hypothetical protein
VAVAALRFRSSGVEIWLADDRGEPTERLGVIAGDARAEPFPIRVIEELRGHLVKLDIVPADPAESDEDEPRARPASAAKTPRSAAPVTPRDDGVATSSKSVEAGARTPRRRLWAEAGGAATIAAGGFGGIVQALVGVRVEPEEQIGLGALALLPLTANEVQEAEGTAEALVNLFAVAIDYRLGDSSSSVTGTIGLGGGVAVLAMEGDAVSPYTATKDRVALGVAFLRGGVGYRFNDWLGVHGGPMLGVSAPRSVVKVRGRDVAAWGRAFASAFVGLEFGVPTPFDGAGEP